MMRRSYEGPGASERRLISRKHHASKVEAHPQELPHTPVLLIECP